MRILISRVLPLLLLVSALPTLRAQSLKPAPFQITETTIAKTQAAIRAHRVTMHQLVADYIARIRAYDQSTRLNSIVLINPRALARASQLDAQFARTHKLLPLEGIAVIIKDNYDTAGLQTTGGSLALRGFIPNTDAFMVHRLRQAGAIILAKANMAEWAFSPVVTVSSITGITRNPYDLTRVPAGSSGGPAAAVAANLGEVALGTDTGDSIRGPAADNDLVGIRPTIGLTSRAGIIPLFHHNDVGGPLARTVADAAAVLTVVAGYDPNDPITKLSIGHTHNYTKYLNPNGLKGARIGVLRSYFNTPTTDPQVKALMQKAIADLRAQGATIVDPFVIPNYDKLTKNIWCGDFQSDLDAYLAHHPNAPYHSLKAILASGLYLPASQKEIESAVNPPKSDDRRSPCPDVYHDPRKIAFRNAVLKAMNKAHIDAIVYPTWRNPPRKIGDMKSPAGDNNQILSPQTGFPAITVPMGFTHGDLPAGISFLGRLWSEPTLIKYAYAYEHHTHHRKPPARFGPLPR